MSSTDHPFRTAVSADGTAIAYEEFGTGTPLILVSGATAHRALMRAHRRGVRPAASGPSPTTAAAGSTAATPCRTRWSGRSRTSPR